MKEFLQKRAHHEAINEKKILTLREQITELEIKLQAKEDEIALLSDTMVT